MYLEVHNMLRRERYCRKHITTWPKKTKVGNIFRYVMSLPKKAQFWDAYRPMRFWFWCSKHGRWQFFLEDRFSSFDRDLKNTKIMVPMNPEGVHGQPPPVPQLQPTRITSSKRTKTSSSKDSFQHVIRN